MGTASNAPNNAVGPNPEHSTIVTPSYRQTYADRWLNDGLTVVGQGTNGADMLDRAIYPVPGSCGRSEDTYDNVVNSSPYEGAFVANISGPVRAIRSHIGANSFTYTVQTEYFYPGREDTTIELRGHGGLPCVRELRRLHDQPHRHDLLRQREHERADRRCRRRSHAHHPDHPDAAGRRCGNW